jgi:hypothetical protein
VGVVEPEPLLSGSRQLVYVTSPWWSNRGTAADAATIVAGDRAAADMRSSLHDQVENHYGAPRCQHGGDTGPKASGLGLRRM